MTEYVCLMSRCGSELRFGVRAGAVVLPLPFSSLLLLLAGAEEGPAGEEGESDVEPSRGLCEEKAISSLGQIEYGR